MIFLNKVLTGMLLTMFASPPLDHSSMDKGLIISARVTWKSLIITEFNLEKLKFGLLGLYRRPHFP